jgi:pimeloyl-ACP methyl ester carboxylesterase
MTRRAFIGQALGLGALAASLSVAGGTAIASAASAAEHRVVDLDLFDTRRRRLVPARLYLPQAAVPGQAVPLVIFSHGLGGSRMGYRYLGSHWANEGIASLHPQHVGSDSSVWRGNPLDLVQRMQSAVHESEALARVLDLRFALDQLLASDLAPGIDASRIAVAGHSYGANTAMLMAGARVTVPDADGVELQDHRIQAAILISAPPLLGQGPVDQVLSPVRLPTLHITSLEDTINIPGYRSTVTDRIEIFHAMRQSPKTLAVFKLGGHNIFTDRNTRAGPEISERIKTATRELSTLFLQQLESAPPQRMRPSDGDAGATEAHRNAGPGGSHAVAQGMQRWQLRHEALLERFVMPDRGILGAHHS